MSGRPFGGGSSGNNLFGGAANSSNKDNKPTIGGFKFGAPGTDTSTTAAEGGSTSAKPTAGGLSFGGAASTPATSGTTGFSFSNATNAGSTTPASTPLNTGLFGGNQPSPGGMFFGGGANKPASGGLFGGASSTPTSTTPAKSPTSMFGAPVSSAPASSAAASTTPAAPVPGGSGLFGSGFGAKPAETKPTGSTFGAAPTSTDTKPTASLFGNPATTLSTTPASSAPAAGGFSFGGGNASKPAVAGLFGTPTSTPAASGIFGGGSTSAPAASKPADTPATSAPSTSGFFGKPADSSSGTATTTAGSAPAKTAFAGTPATLGGGFLSTPTTNKPATTTPGVPSFGATATQPPPQSRLKNKSMEEIIGRWTSDLEKYKAEFLSQAQEVKKWDGVLIGNGDKLVNLLAETTEAEKTQARMDTVLQQLENEQEELGTALDYYESQIKDFFEIQFGSAEGMQPADQEREKTYRMAEQLNETLIGMEGDLGEMIKAINKAGATINKTSNADDPLSQIVKILNDHLGSLQWIDTHTTQVAEKIQEAQRKGNERSSTGALGGEDDFFPSESYRGGMLR